MSKARRRKNIQATEMLTGYLLDEAYGLIKYQTVLMRAKHVLR